VSKTKKPTYNVDVIIQNYRIFFKDNISIDKADSFAYRTIILQVQQAK